MVTPTFTFESWAVSHPGRVRASNEDRYLMEPEAGLWLVADGMGGHDSGEVASSLIVEQLATLGIPSTASDQHARFIDRLTRANHDILSYSSGHGGVVGSTVVALLVFADHYRCLWMGDSRVYRLRGGTLEQLSRDHSEVEDLVTRGVLSREEARSWRGRNVITRAVGVTAALDIEVVYGTLASGDIYVLCSDGLTAHCSDEDIRSAVAADGPEKSVETLLDLTLSRGGTDNVTIVVVLCHGGPVGPPDAGAAAP